jgi:hypothetical protein
MPVYIEAEEAATSPAIVGPGDLPQLFDTSGDEPPDRDKLVLSSEVLSNRFMDTTKAIARVRDAKRAIAERSGHNI